MNGLLSKLRHAAQSGADAADSICDAVRDAIVTGHLKAGESLPTMRELADATGVTFRVARGVVERLAREGYVKSRPHAGTVVLPKRHTVWRGRVVFVAFEDDCASYFVSALADAVRRKLLEADYLFSHIVASRHPDGDCSQLKTMLGQNVDFVVLMYAAGHLERIVAKSGVPYVVVYGTTPSRPNAWSIPFAIDGPIATFVEHCRRADVRSVTEVWVAGDTFQTAGPGLKAADVRVRRLVVEPLADYGRLEGIERAAMERFLAMKKSEFPDLFLFWDDFVAQGAFTAFLKRGIRLPEDVKVVVQSNRGLGPVYPDSITRFECDGTAVGGKVAAFVLGVLAKGRLPPVPVISPTYVFGRTFAW